LPKLTLTCNAALRAQQNAVDELSDQLGAATEQLDRARQQLSEASHENTTLRNLLRDSEQQLTAMADLERQFAAMKRRLELLEDDYTAAEQEWEEREQSLQVRTQIPFVYCNTRSSIFSTYFTLHIDTNWLPCYIRYF
jgi:chromosome segregation ATPase